MRFFFTWLLFSSILFLTSCAYQPNPVPTSSASEEISDTTIPSREAVYTYGQGTALKKIIIFKIGGEPLLFPSGYVRLVGVVSGVKPLASWEIGGRGLALVEGEAIDDYRIIRIKDDSVILERK